MSTKIGVPRRGAVSVLVPKKHSESLVLIFFINFSKVLQFLFWKFTTWPSNRAQ